MKKRLTYNMIDFILTFLKVFVRITARNTFGTHHLCRITQDNNGNLTRVKYFRENQTKKETIQVSFLSWVSRTTLTLTQANCKHLMPSGY